MTSLLSPDTRINLRVSSVLNRDNASFGKQHLLDGSEETCWNSEQGLPQNILLDFGSPVLAYTMALTFQGGFVGKTCVVFASTAQSPNDYSINMGRFYPEDINSTQSFDLMSSGSIQRLKIVFEESTDFYGRITVYKLDILGSLL
ncbi:galactose-binding domain-like protein [Spinellus fusiger]|nr:galactose-binding domain-like protein [Spinellus fusiger]